MTTNIATFRSAHGSCSYAFAYDGTVAHFQNGLYTTSSPGRIEELRALIEADPTFLTEVTGTDVVDKSGAAFIEQIKAAAIAEYLEAQKPRDIGSDKFLQPAIAAASTDDFAAVVPGARPVIHVPDNRISKQALDTLAYLATKHANVEEVVDPVSTKETTSTEQQTDTKE